MKIKDSAPVRGFQVLAVVFIGLLAFVAWGGVHILSPRHFAWLMSGGDTPAHYLGWEYFRSTAWWQWPLGANPNYGNDAPGTIVMSDSIPVAAFFFKLWRAWLPAGFQYFGIWLLLCFVLQAWFGYCLMRRVSADFWLCLLGCCFFTLATIFLVRVYLHPALAAQWILLAGIYLGLDKQPRIMGWWALLLFASLVHAYLLVMSAALWFACMVHHARIRSMSPLAMLGYVLAVMCSIVLTMWAAGYFVPEAVQPLNSRTYANLLFPVWPGFCTGDVWSLLIPCSKLDSLATAMQLGDGFGYFGLGYLALAVLALVLLSLGKKAFPASSGRPWPMLAASLLLLIYALGDRIYAGPDLLFNIHWPGMLDYAAHVFRGAGRMIWPLWYLCLFMVLAMAISGLGARYAKVVMLLALIVQCMDLSGAVTSTRESIKKKSSGSAELASPQWTLLNRQYRHFVFIRSNKLPAYLVGWSPGYRALTLQAVRSGLSVNIGYLSRMNESALDIAKSRREALLLSGNAEPSTYYVIEDDDLWRKVLCAPDLGQWHGVMDSTRLLVPNPSPSLVLPPASVGQDCAE